MTSRRHVLTITVLAALLIISCSLPVSLFPTNNGGPATPTTRAPLVDCLPANAVVESATVVSIVDGDTVDVTIGGRADTVRYIGIDTPERGDPLYREAAARNGALVLGKEVLLVKDVSETDRFERLLRYVFVDGVFVNEVLVREGFAYAKEYRPDIACAEVLNAAQRMAEAAQIGIWGLPVPQFAFTPTTAVTATQTPAGGMGSCPTGCEAPAPGCEIKGNINRDAEKIYHIPGSGSYTQTQIDPAKGERWFCTVEEAESNGWRAPRQ